MRNAIVLLTVLAAGCGGSSPVDMAVKAADKACACTEYGCAKGVVSEFNKYSLQNSDQVKALAGEDKEKYSAAVDRMSTCRDKLKQ